MAKFIKEIHDLYGIYAGKNIASKPSPEKIDLALYEVIVSVFNSNYEVYAKTQQISDFLGGFKKSAIVSFTGGTADLPPDYAHCREIEGASLILDKFWKNRVSSSINGPSAGPICRIEHDGTKVVLEVLPTTVTSVRMLYFKKPTRPKYAYTVSGDRYVYDDAGSSDLEFDIMQFPALVTKLLSRFGIALREQQVTEYAERARAQEMKS